MAGSRKPALRRLGQLEIAVPPDLLLPTHAWSRSTPAFLKAVVPSHALRTGRGRSSWRKGQGGGGDAKSGRRYRAAAGRKLGSPAGREQAGVPVAGRASPGVGVGEAAVLAAAAFVQAAG